MIMGSTLRARWGERRLARRVATPEIFLVVSGLLVRLAIGLPAQVGTSGDQGGYLTFGRNLAAGHGYSLSTRAPFYPGDFRMPGYPAVVALADWLGVGLWGLIAVNCFLGALAVLAVVRIARIVFPAQPAAVWVAGAVMVFCPTFVTYTNLALAENLSIPALCWFVYLGFFAPIRRQVWWAVALVVTSAWVVMARAEGVAVVVVGVILMGLVKRVPVRLTALLLVLVLVIPAGWLARNSIQIGRQELTDPMDTYVTLVLSVTDGNFNDPLYIRGVQLASEGAATHPAQRQAEEAAVRRRITSQLDNDTTRVLDYKVKGLLNLPFVPLVYAWSADADYDLTSAIQHPNFKNTLRIAWSLFLLALYVFAVMALVRWWRRGHGDWVVGVMLYPVIAFLLAIPFHSELRLWFDALGILIVPGVAGAFESKAWTAQSAAPAISRELLAADAERLTNGD